MNIKSILIVFFIMLSLPACTVTRTRYGNGLNINFGNRFSRDLGNNKASAPEKKKKTSVVSFKAAAQNGNEAAKNQVSNPELSTEPEIENKSTTEYKSSVESTVKQSQSRNFKKANKLALKKQASNGQQMFSANEEKGNVFQSNVQSKANQNTKNDGADYLFEIIGAFLEGLLYSLLVCAAVGVIILAIVDPMLLLNILLTLILGGSCLYLSTL